MIGFIIGSFLGTWFGLFIGALCSMASRSDESTYEEDTNGKE